MEFIEYLKGIFLYIPKNFDEFIANPYSTLYYAFLLLLLITGRFGFFFKTIFITFIFFAGFFYSVINPVVDNKIVSIIIFAVTSLFILVIFLLNFIVKGK